MKQKHFKIFSKLLLSISISLFALFLISSTIIFISSFKLDVQLDTLGISYFLDVFSPSIKLGTATVVFFTLWLTFKRMEQTEYQLSLNQDNVNFNNFYKHKEEFDLFLNKMSIITIIKKNYEIDVEALYPAVYSHYYNSSYKNFKPSLNEGAKKEIDNFIKMFKKSAISNKDSDLNNTRINEINEIIKIAKAVNHTLYPICKIHVEIELKRLKYNLTSMGGYSKTLVEERFENLAIIHSAIQFLESFLAFDGIYQSERAAFMLNFLKYQKKYKL